MRTLLNVLAVIIGLTSGVMALAGCAGLGVVLYADFRGNTEVLVNSWGWLGIAASASAVVIGGVIASRAWLHLRHPDPGTVRDMIGTAIFLIVIMGVMPLIKSPVGLLVIIGLYFFHRTLVSRINARAFPAPESHA